MAPGSDVLRGLSGALTLATLVCGAGCSSAQEAITSSPLEAGADRIVPTGGPDGASDAPFDVAPDAVTADREASVPSRDAAFENPSVGDEPGAMRCNGYAALCDRRFDQVVFPTTHNAMSNADDGWLTPNQTHSMARQLQDGIRAMLIDSYSYQGAGYLCHRTCVFGGNKKLIDALGEIVQFLRDNPHEVLAFVIEDNLSAADTGAAFVESQLGDFVYVHPGGPWPTLRTMIESGHRVVVGAEMGGPPPPWYHHFYDLAWDTPYSFRSPSDFSCEQNRGVRANALFLLNHWLENPFASEALSGTANAHDMLLGRARQCQTESGKLPNFVAVNHYSIGDLFQVVRELNGL